MAWYIAACLKREKRNEEHNTFYPLTILRPSND